MVMNETNKMGDCGFCDQENVTLFILDGFKLCRTCTDMYFYFEGEEMARFLKEEGEKIENQM